MKRLSLYLVLNVVATLTVCQASPSSVGFDRPGSEGFLNPDLLENIQGFLGTGEARGVSKEMNAVCCRVAVQSCAQALMNGMPIPMEAKFVLSPNALVPLDEITHKIIQEMKFNENNMDYFFEAHRRGKVDSGVGSEKTSDEERDEIYSYIRLPNPIPPLLKDHVVEIEFAENVREDETFNRYMVDHILAGMGYFYQVKPSSGTDMNTDEAKKVRTLILEGIEAHVREETKKYLLYEDAVGREEAIPAEVEYVVLPTRGGVADYLKRQKDEINDFFKHHPDITLVISFMDEVTKVDCRNSWDPFPLTTLQRLSFTGRDLSEIGVRFFPHGGLTTVDFRGLCALKSVGDKFFAFAENLTSVDLRGLSALESVGDNFFSYAENLTSVDLRGLSALKSAGDYFFYQAVNLPTVDFRGLCALKHVGNDFFREALSLTTVDFRVPSLMIIGDNLFKDTPQLQTITCDSSEQARLIKKKYKGEAEILVEKK